MSATERVVVLGEPPDSDGRVDQPEPAELPLPAAPGATGAVTVRRNVVWSLLVAALASTVAIAYLDRATGGGATLDWVLCALTALLAAVHLGAVLDARTPLLVADGDGVRIRLGSQWRGMPWDALAQVVVRPRAGRFRDGRLVVTPHTAPRLLDGLDRRARWQVRLNRKLYGAPLVVPLGLVTRVSRAGERSIADQLALLSSDRSDVVSVVEALSPAGSGKQTPAVAQAADSDAPRGGPRSGLGRAVAARLSRRERVDVSLPDDAGAPILPVLSPAARVTVPLRGLRHGRRVELISGGLHSAVDGTAALDPSDNGAPTVRRLPEERHLRRPGIVDLEFEDLDPLGLLDRPGTTDQTPAPLAALRSAPSHVDSDPLPDRPVATAVIGPELAAARLRVGLTVDELAERTRIRPHVIEAIELDDFGPCGGDVYARGHIRTLARMLGRDAVPLLESFDNRYAEAPISARRVFEAELASGTTGSLRSMSGGSNWTLLVGIVLTLVLVWGVVRLFAGAPNEMVENPPPLPDDSSFPSMVYGETAVTPAPPPQTPLRLVALNASTRVQVTDAAGKVVMAQRLVYGETVTLRVSLPVSVSADNGGALVVKLGKRDLGLLGEAGQPTVREYGDAATR